MGKKTPQPPWEAHSSAQQAFFSLVERGGGHSTWAEAFLLCPSAQVQLKALKEHFCIRNERASHEKCTATLQELFQDLDRRINDRIYSVLGGYQLFQKDQKALVEQYWELPGKGVKVGTRTAPWRGQGLHIPLPPPKKNTCPELLLHSLTPALPMSLQADAALRDFLQERESTGRKILKDDLEITLALTVSCLSFVGCIALKIKR